MKVEGIVEIFDDEKFLSVVTITGTTIRFPEGKHSIVIVADNGNDVDIEVTLHDD